MYNFLRKYYQPIDGEFYYEVIAVAYDEKIAKVINDSIPFMSDKENVICCTYCGGCYEQYDSFRYDFQHEYDETLGFYG